MFIFSTSVLLAIANCKLIKTTMGVSNIHNIANITKLHRNINFQSSFCHNSHTNSNTKRYKSPQRTYHYRNIEGIDLELFEQTILSSSLFSSPDSTVDGFANQMETELTSILEKVAPLKTGHGTGPRKGKNWLSLEAVDAKKRRRRLERLPMPNLTALPIGLLARLQTS